MKWILCYLNPNDYVTYITDISNNAESSPYNEFLTFIYPYTITNHKEFLEQINRYLTIFIDTQNYTWKVYRREQEPATFDELFELNKQREEQKKQKNSDISSYKKWIDSKYDKKYDRSGANREGRGVSIQSFFNRFRKK